MEYIIRYRHYRHEEAVRLWGNWIFYSRSSRFRGNCPGQPDTVRVVLENTKDLATPKILSVVIELNQTGRTIDLTNGQGYRKTADGLYKKMAAQVRIRENCRTIDVLGRLLAAMDKVVNELPILLYATTHAKQVYDYIHFMQSAIPKIHKWELADFFNLVPCKHDIAYFGLVNDYGVDSFYTARLPNGNWAAWIDGDELIPTFQEELQAYHFMKKRLMLYDGFSCIDFEVLTGIQARMDIKCQSTFYDMELTSDCHL